MKRAVELGVGPEWYPVGREIEDTWNGEDAPLIVAQYLDETNNEAYGGAEGVICVRKYPLPPPKPFGDTGVTRYKLSTIKSYLEGQYYEKSSGEIKSVIAPISIPLDDSILPNQTWFLMSVTEVGGVSRIGIEGIAWDYWKDKLGSFYPTNNRITMRKIRDAAGIARNIWLRSRYDSYFTYYVDTVGAIANTVPSNDEYVFPACFIGKTPTE